MGRTKLRTKPKNAKLGILKETQKFNKKKLASASFFAYICIMNYKLTKQVIEVNEAELKAEIIELCKRTKKAMPNVIGIGTKTLKDELGLKLTQLQFVELCHKLGLPLWLNKFISFSKLNLED